MAFSSAYITLGSLNSELLTQRAKVYLILFLSDLPLIFDSLMRAPPLSSVFFDALFLRLTLFGCQT